MPARKTSRGDPTIAASFDDRLNAFEPIPLVVDYQKSFFKTFQPINIQENNKVFRLHDGECFMNPKSAMLLIRGRLLRQNEDGTTSQVPTVQRMMKLKESQDFVAEPEAKVEQNGIERVVLKKKQVLREVEVLNGCALTPINFFSAALFHNLQIKYNNTLLPLSSRQMYYFQSLFNMLLTVKDVNAMFNFQNGMWMPDTVGSSVSAVTPFEDNQGLSERFSRAGSSKLITMCTPLFANGFSEIDKLIPPGVSVEILLEMAKPQFYMVSNDDTQGVFKIDDIQIMLGFHQLTTKALETWNVARKLEIPRFNYKEKLMNWMFVKKNSSTHRFTLEPTLLPGSSLPEKLLSSFTTASSFFGSYKLHSGWLSGKHIKSVAIDKGDNTPQTILNSIDEIWAYSMRVTRQRSQIQRSQRQRSQRQRSQATKEPSDKRAKRQRSQ